MPATLSDPSTMDIAGSGGGVNGAAGAGTPPAQLPADDSRQGWREAVNAQLSAEAAEQPAPATPPPQQQPPAQPAAPPAAQPAATAPAAADAQTSAAQAAATLRAQIQAQYGLDMSGLQNDEQILPFLVQRVQEGQQVAARAQQLSEYARYGQLYLQHQHDFNRYLSAQGQGQPAPPAPAQPASPFQLPAWNQQLEVFIGRDDKGQLTEKPGAPPGTLAQYLSYQHARQELADKLVTNPQELLGPWMEQVAAQKAEELVKANMGQYQDQVNATNFVSQNSQWLHQRDVTGSVVMDPFSGMPKLSPYGERFRHYVVQLSNAGVQDMRVLQSVAMQQLRADIAQVQLAQGQAGAQQAAGNQQVIQQGNRQPSQSGNLLGVPGTGGAQQQPVVDSGEENASFAQMFRAALKAQGVKDSDLMETPEAA